MKNRNRKLAKRKEVRLVHIRQFRRFRSISFINRFRHPIYGCFSSEESIQGIFEAPPPSCPSGHHRNGKGERGGGGEMTLFDLLVLPAAKRWPGRPGKNLPGIPRNPWSEMISSQISKNPPPPSITKRIHFRRIPKNFERIPKESWNKLQRILENP